MTNNYSILASIGTRTGSKCAIEIFDRNTRHQMYIPDQLINVNIGKELTKTPFISYIHRS